MKRYIVGIDLGGTKIAAALANPKGKILNQITIPTEAKKGPQAVLSNLKRAIKAVSQSHRISSIGVSAAGPIDHRTGVIKDPPNLPFKKLDLKQGLRKFFKVPVYIENDANAAALAEFKFGSGRKAKNFIFVTISTGIGGGIIINGKLYRGANGAAGEIGHMVIDKNGPKCGCGLPGDMEALGSGRAFKPDPIAVEKAAKKGKAWAKKNIDKVARDLGYGFASLINIFNPEMIIVGGGISNMGEILFKPLRRYAKKFALPLPAKTVKIVGARFKNDAALMGAVAICIQKGQ